MADTEDTTIRIELSPTVRGTVFVKGGSRSAWILELSRLGFRPHGVPGGKGLESLTYRRSVLPEDPAAEGEVAALQGNRMFLMDPTNRMWVRHDIRDAILGWADGSRPTLGGFLTAVMENNLSEAVSRADSYNQVTLPAIVGLVINAVPMAARGRENMAAWQERHIQRLREARS